MDHRGTGLHAAIEAVSIHRFFHVYCHTGGLMSELVESIPILFVHFGDEQLRGSERVLLDLLTGLESKYRPVVWCNSHSLENEVSRLGLPVHRTPMPVLLHYRSPKLDVRGYVRLVQAGMRLIDGYGIRLVHATSGAPTQWMVPAARARRVPLIVTLPSAYVQRDRCLLLLHQASAVVGCSRAALAGLQDDGVPPERLKVIHNSVDLHRLSSGSATDLRRALSIPEDAPVVASVGALAPIKGVDVLMRAFGLLRDLELRPPPHLLVVGDGPARGELEALVSELGIGESVHFLGAQANVGAILRDAVDVLALPSRSEAFGIVLVEAAIFGLPVVASAVGGIPEVVEDGETGLLVPPEDAPAVAEAIARLITDPPLRERMGLAARRRAEREFTLARFCGEFAALYDSQLDQPRRYFGWRRSPLSVTPWLRYGKQMVKRRIARIA